MNFKDSEWQREAWRLYDLIGELRFVSNFIGSAISQCRLYVARKGPDGEPAEEVKEGPIARLAGVPLGSGNTRDENLRKLGIQLYVPGEGFVVGEGAMTEDERDKWFVVSGNEIETAGNQTWVNRPRDAGGGKLMLRDDRDVLIRIWTPHPKVNDEPDSPVRSAIPVLTEILLLMKREFAELESRLVGAGMMPMPEGLDFPKDEGELGGLDGFVLRLAKIAEQGMANHGTAADMLPEFFTVPDQYMEHLDKLKPIRFWSDLSENITTMLDKAIARTGMALDIPPEVLTGSGGSSRWATWLADEQVIKIHIRPPLSRIAEGATNVYLRAALEAMGEDPDAYMYAFDTAPLAVRPNRSEDALNFWDRGLMNDDAARKEGAFPDSVAMTEEQRIKHIVMRATEREPSLLADPGIRAILGITANIAPVNDQDGRPREIEPDPPKERRALPSGERPRRREAERNTAQEMAAACKLAVLRALELAGGRLTNHAVRRRHPDTPKHLMHCKVGPVTQDAAARILAGAWDHLDLVADAHGVRVQDLTAVLNMYCTELLTRGLAHDDDLLIVALKAAMREPVAA